MEFQNFKTLDVILKINIFLINKVHQSLYNSISLLTCRNALFDAETACVLPTKLGTAKVDGLDWKTGFGWIIGAKLLDVIPSGFKDGVTTVTDGVKQVFCC